MERPDHRTRAWLAAALTVVIAGCAASVVGPATPAPTLDTSPSAAATPSTPVASTSVSPQPTVGAGESWIAFQQFTSKAIVVLARADGSGLHSPTGDVPGGDQTNPDWAPGGDALVFAVTIDGRDDLWVVRADGTGARALLDCEGPCLSLDDPAWSPDGRTVLYSRMTEADGDGVATLERVDVTTGAVEVLVTAMPNDFYAGQRWSPDGRAVVLEVVHRTGPGLDAEIEDVTLAIIDLAAPTPTGRAITEPGLFPETADWSPDGSEIVYGALAEPGAEATDLYAVRPDATGLRRLTTLVDDGGSATHPDVSPDGSRIVFAAQLAGDDRYVLAAIDPDGGAVAPATGGDTYLDGVHPRLRPIP